MANQRDRDDPAIAPTLNASDEAGILDTTPVARQTDPDSTGGDRYAIGERLGQGGMGEIRQCTDGRIGREVAMKVLLPGRRDAGERFLREVRVQGGLEHPAIVPVYDLGVRDDDRLFFTMRRLTGRTLNEIIAAQRAGDRAARDRHPRAKLLTAFAAVCQAIEYAHQRGILHRDIKPDNIMLGDYGEVYVLDWGIALKQYEPGTSADEDEQTGQIAARTTLAGTVLGTPGYMAPEQVRGDVAALSAATDVYALGMVLFEILTLSPANPGKTIDDLLEETILGVDCRISRRCPALDIAPELEAICVRACAKAPERRYASVRAMLDDIERYLDGDRDLARRQELAEKHALRALKVLGDGSTLEQRAAAMSEAGRALALDPESEEAAQLVTRLVLQPPREMPEQVVEGIERSQHESTRALTRLASGVLAMLVLLSLGLFLADVINKTAMIALPVVLATSAVLSYVASRQAAPSKAFLLVLLILSSSLLGLMAYGLSPFIIVPAAAAFICTAFLMHHHLRPWWIVPLAAGAGVIGPLLLELAGVLPPSFRFENNTLKILPRMFEFDDGVLLIILLTASLTLLSLNSIFVNRLRNHHIASDRRLLLQAWHLRQAIVDDRATADTIPPED